MPLSMAERKKILPLVQDAVVSSDHWLILADLLDDDHPTIAARLRAEPWIPDVLEALSLGDYRATATRGRVAGVIQSVASVLADHRKRLVSQPVVYRREDGMIVVSDDEARGLLLGADRVYTPDNWSSVLKVCAQRAHCVRLLEAALRGLTVPPDVCEVATDCEVRAWNLILKGAY